MAPVICPRSTILQRAAASSVEGMVGVTDSTADRIATFGFTTSSLTIMSMAFCSMSILVSRSVWMLTAASVTNRVL